jgi:hypothetical protein
MPVPCKFSPLSTASASSVGPNTLQNRVSFLRKCHQDRPLPVKKAEEDTAPDEVLKSEAPIFPVSFECAIDIEKAYEDDVTPHAYENRIHV